MTSSTIRLRRPYDIADEALASLDATGGASVNELGNTFAEGYMVSRYGWEIRLQPEVARRLNAGALRDLIAEFAEACIAHDLYDDEADFIGLWRADDDSLCIDLSRHYLDFCKAISIAEQHQQDAVYEIHTGRSIPV